MLICALLVYLFTAVSLATVCGSMWMDPTWEQMLKESELVALVEVTQGGNFFAKAKPLRVFTGEAPPDFYVTGFNNHGWPSDAIGLEALKKGQRYYLFLRQGEEAVHEIEFLAETRSPVILLPLLHEWLRPEFRRLFYQRRFLAPLEAAKHGRLWSVWTPSAGDLPVEGEHVRYRLWISTLR